MEKEFVTYNQASALKDLGFDKPCLGYWSDWGTQEPFLLTCELGTEKESCSIRRKNFLCKGPTYSQAFRFFREKYELDSFVNAEWKQMVKVGYYFNAGDYYSPQPNRLTYEEAELECLRKLIEIVKS